MVAPFPPNPQQPYQPAGGVPPPASPFAQPGFAPGSFPSAPPPPPQSSNGCLKGCCIVAVILGILGVGGVVLFGLTWKRWASKLMAVGIIDQCPDLTADEKAEGKDLLEKSFDCMTGEKSKDQKRMQDLANVYQELQDVGRDGKVEGREVRPVFGRLKKLLKDAGYSFPSPLFPYVAESEFKLIPKGTWMVEIQSVKQGSLDKAAAALASRTQRSVADCEVQLRALPALVIEGTSKDYAAGTRQDLEEAGCTVLVKDLGK